MDLCLPVNKKVLLPLKNGGMLYDTEKELTLIHAGIFLKHCVYCFIKH